MQAGEGPPAADQGHVRAAADPTRGGVGPGPPPHHWRLPGTRGREAGSGTPVANGH